VIGDRREVVTRLDRRNRNEALGDADFLGVRAQFVDGFFVFGGGHVQFVRARTMNDER
jgi:hypothetical protein